MRSKKALKVLGKSLPRLDAVEKVMGSAKYVADLSIDGMVEGKVLRSSYPHAIIKSINTWEAESLEGVLGVIASSDFQNDDPYLGSTYKDQPVIATDRVRYIGEPVCAVAALDEVTADEALRLKPYMILGELLGGFSGQIIRTGLQSVTIEYEGHAASLNTKPITACMLKGLMAPNLETVNMVNAPVIARERDIGVSVVNHERECEYQSLVRLNVKTETRNLSIAGTLIGGDKPRIVDIDGVPMEASLGPRMLYTVNKDMPGIIGAFGMAMADEGINIANFILGRTKPGGVAVALLELDKEIGENMLERIQSVPHVLEVTQLNFPSIKAGN